ncbi:MAG: hypothetical protein S4CHLAM81_06760 [Chlamydiales bacterium]|nr:hypothetical protein [Chlamydiales bacterium]MCH9635460.1 hypothetical protein [Chlamydiales bacterium]MCH9703440.1 hypothetical protein [Chlamydiota bacterium]
MRRILFLSLLLFLSAARQAQGPVYIIHADQGMLEMKSKQTAILMLEEVDQTVPFIYSHPVRRVGAQNLTEFMRVWAAGDRLQYENDPPDAHLFYYDARGGDYVDLLVELTSVAYTEGATSMSFELRFLSDQPDIKENLGEVTLFIDCYPFCI